MLSRVVFAFFLLFGAPGLFGNINGDRTSPDGRFRVEAFGDDSLKIVNERGRSIFNLESIESGHGTYLFWSRDSERLVVIVQWKWATAMEAVEYDDGSWKKVAIPDSAHECDEKAQIYLGIKVFGGPWQDNESYFEDFKWLGPSKFQYTETLGYGNGNGPKDMNADRKELRLATTMEFGPDSLVVDDIAIAAPAKSIDPTPVPVEHQGGRIENDPRYAPLDYRLNEVYSALRARLSSFRREQLRLMEREFLSRRDRLRNNPDGFFALTEQQISILQQMYDAL